MPTVKAPAASRPAWPSEIWPGIAGQQHQRQRADRGEKDLAGEIELEWRGDERKAEQRDARTAPALTRCERVSTSAKSWA